MSERITYTRFLGLDENCMQDDTGGYSPDMCDFCVTADGRLKKRSGYLNMYTSSAHIDGMWSGHIGTSDVFVFASDKTLYKLNVADCTATSIGSISGGECCFFEFDGKLYILTGAGYYSYDGVTLKSVEGYVPVIAHSCVPSGEGTMYETPNLLTGRRRQRFSSDGKSRVYRLAEQSLSAVERVTVGGVAATDYICDLTNGTVTFTDSSIPKEGINNVEVFYRKGGNRRYLITSCRYAMLFGGNVDGRVFLYGDTDNPCNRYHSELANGTPSAEYFPENNYTVIGNTDIRCIVQQYDRQLIFTKDRAYYSLCEVRQSATGAYYASFPVYNLNGEKGSLLGGVGCIIDNDPVTFCGDGINRWVSTAVSNEKNAVVISSRVSKSMREALIGGDYSGMRLFDRQATREMLFVTKNKCLVYNYATGVWYRYSSILPEFMTEYRGSTFFSMGKSIKRLGDDVLVDDGNAINAYWVGPMSALGDPTVCKNVDAASVTVECAVGAHIGISFTDGNRSTVGAKADAYISPGVSVFSYRPHVKRVYRAGIKITFDGYATDGTLCSLSLITKTKGRRMPNG